MKTQPVRPGIFAGSSPRLQRSGSTNQTAESRNLVAFTQMTSEVVSDDEYLPAMYHKMRVRTALLGIESFTQEGRKSANKQWNPVGQRTIETIPSVQDRAFSC